MSDEITSIITSIESLTAEFAEFQQPRSDFALRHFVIGQHDLPGRQRQQAVLELQGKLFAIKRARIAREKSVLTIDKERKRFETGDELTQREAQLEIDGAMVDLEEVDLAMLGAIREANTLLAILSSMPTYTREALEAEEAEYWVRRLTRQYVIGGRDVGGNLDAVLQTYTEPGTAKPVTLGSFEEVKGLLGLE